MNNGGDALARGGKSATFGPPKVSQEDWDKIWADEPKETFDAGGSPNIKESANGKSS